MYPNYLCNINSETIRPGSHCRFGSIPILLPTVKEGIQKINPTSNNMRMPLKWYIEMMSSSASEFEKL